MNGVSRFSFFFRSHTFQFFLWFTINHITDLDYLKVRILWTNVFYFQVSVIPQRFASEGISRRHAIQSYTIFEHMSFVISWHIRGIFAISGFYKIIKSMMITMATMMVVMIMVIITTKTATAMVYSNDIHSNSNNKRTLTYRTTWLYP